MTDLLDVLIVEDEPVVAKAIGQALSCRNLSWHEARDVDSAQRHLMHQSFKVVLTDLKLPGSSGFEILDYVGGLEPRPEVIMITGYATRENTLDSFRLGAFDFLPKPFDVAELLGVVDRAVRFFERPERAPAELQSPAIQGGDRYWLGRHSWARLDPDGAATVGVAETFSGVIDTLHSIECIRTDEHTIQGRRGCVLRAVEDLVYRVWAPLSGRVLAQNPEVAGDLDLITRDPLSAGWLFRIIPGRLNEETPRLIRQADLLD